MEAGRATGTTTAVASVGTKTAGDNQKENAPADNLATLQQRYDSERNIIQRPYPSDTSILNDKWTHVFVGKTKTESIFNAIAQFDPTNKSIEARETLTKDIETTKIPKDFILDKEVWTAAEERSRAQFGLSIFRKDKVQDGDQPTPLPVGDTSLSVEKECRQRIENLKEMLSDYQKPRMEAIWLERFSSAFPGYTWGGGKKITCLSDLIAAISCETYDKELKAIVHHSLNGMWFGNDWADGLEQSAMAFFKIEYTDELCDTKKDDEGNPIPAKPSKSGCIRTFFVKKKQSTFLKRIRSVIAKKKREIPYKKGPGADGATPSKHILKMVPANVKTDGYIGWRGLMAGHPELGPMPSISISPVAVNNAEVVLNNSLSPEAVNNGKVVTVPADLAAWFYGCIKKGMTTSGHLLEDLEQLELRGIIIGKTGTGMHPESKAVSPQGLNQDTTEFDVFMEKRKKEKEGLVGTDAIDSSYNKEGKKAAQKKRKPEEMSDTDDDSDEELLALARKMRKKPPSTPTKTPPSQPRRPTKSPAPAPGTPAKTPPSQPKRPNKSAKKDLGNKKKSSASTLAAVTKNLSPAPQSDERCDHGNEPWVNFQKWDQSYYHPGWLANADMETYPTNCNRCKREFVNKAKADVDVDKEVKVTKGRQVHVCPNATKDDHQCTYAICKPCVDALCIIRNSPVGKENLGKRKPPKRSTRGDSAAKRQLME